MGTNVFLTNVRLSYPQLEVPRYYKDIKQKETDKRSWSAAFLIGPESMAQHMKDGTPVGTPVSAKKFIDDALEKLAHETWNDKAKLKLMNILPDPKACAWQDGAKKEMADTWVLTGKRTEDKGRPIVIDNDKSPIYKKDSNELQDGKAGRLFAGCFVNAHVELWSQKSPAPEGLRCGLVAIQRLRTGDSFGGGATPTADVFGEITDGADDEDLS